ncbi:MAG TPA: leucyl aminopeptidase, partial [Bdellovibrionota bacterium]|nr:leucyl aminopeptidase [Bdellovibrionota bacterium]
MNLHIENASPFETTSDCLFVGLFRSEEGDKGKPLFPSNLKKIAPLLEEAISTKVFTAKKNEKIFLRNANIGKTKHLLAVGLGHEKKDLLPTLYQAALKGGSTLVQEKISSVSLFVPSFIEGKLDLQTSAQQLALGIYESTYSFNEYKAEKETPSLATLILVSDNKREESALQKGSETATKIFDGIKLAKDLCNTPPNFLTPEKLVEWGKKATTTHGVKATIFDEPKLEKAKMGGILAVGQGSKNPPRLLVLEYKHSKATAKDKICIVGKGVTFDSGGINIKPSQGMEDMKYDMGGAAMMIGTTLAAAALKLPIHLITIVPSAENMPSGTASRPSDVITMLNGKTIEINNTDAEGRLILADALTYAHTFKPNVIINSATLTGGVLIALGSVAAGLFSNNPKLAEQIKEASKRTGEKVWELPLFEEYKEDLQSGIADYRNSGGREASPSKGGTFLHFFIENHQPWAHLDIAGVAWA